MTETSLCLVQQRLREEIHLLDIGSRLLGAMKKKTAKKSELADKKSKKKSNKKSNKGGGERGVESGEAPHRGLIREVNILTRSRTERERKVGTLGYGGIRHTVELEDAWSESWWRFGWEGG